MRAGLSPGERMLLRRLLLRWMLPEKTMHPDLTKLPPWVVLHLPHVSTVVPAIVRDQFMVDDATLAAELESLSDHHALDIFRAPRGAAPEVRAKVSRLVVDVERFADDAREPAAKHGFGAIYTRTTSGATLRRPLSPRERAALLRRHAAHHAHLEATVDSVLAQHGRCLVLDCHTFPDRAVPFELACPDGRPDVCLGTDPVHTPPELTRAFVAAFEAEGWTVSQNRPFAGALVPANAYATNPRVVAIMVDVNRRICRDASGAAEGPSHPVAVRIRACCARAIAAYEDVAPRSWCAAGGEAPGAGGQPATFDVFVLDERGVLTPAGFREPVTRSDAYEDKVHGWFKSPRDLALVAEGFEPMAWAVGCLYERAREELECEIDRLEGGLEELASADDGQGAPVSLRQVTLQDQLAACRAKLVCMPLDPYAGMTDWLHSLDERMFDEEVAPHIELWLSEEPGCGEEEHFGRASGQEDAFRYFSEMDPDDRAALGVVVIEGEHLGSGYRAAELRCTVAQANSAAAAAGIPVHFVGERSSNRATRGRS